MSDIDQNIVSEVRFFLVSRDSRMITETICAEQRFGNRTRIGIQLGDNLRDSMCSSNLLEGRQFASMDLHLKDVKKVRTRIHLSLSLRESFVKI
jgi:hypothetical protein